MTNPKAVSVRQRLLNRAHETKEDYNQLMARYVGLRFLVRLAVSPYESQFLLKGATLFLVWLGKAHRPTRDIDLLGLGIGDEAKLAQIIKNVCIQAVEPDGLEFDPETVAVERIREDNPYGGIRCSILVKLGTARQKIQIDVGFGDSVDPQPQIVEVPRLLTGEPPVTMRAYRPETSIAEKLDAMVTNGIKNSRMKDFFDIDVLARTMDFDGRVLAKSVITTFQRRRTSMHERVPFALTEAFWTDLAALARWDSFLRRNTLPPESFADVCIRIRTFLEPVWMAAKNRELLNQTWSNQRWT